MNLVEDLGSSQFSSSSAVSTATAVAVSAPPTSGGLEVFTLRMIKNDPFVTISEIRREYIDQDSDEEATWWRVFSILWRHNLVRRRSRFRYAWGRA